MHIDLFTGIGGFTLACHWNGIQTEVMCEKDERCRRFLERTWPGIPIVPDIRDFDGSEWRGRFLLTGGVPCQPASRAGKQRGKADDRWLWPEAIRVVGEALPAWCLFENPPGIYDVGIDGILSDLEGIGYEARPIEIPACAVNAPQIRQRVWIVANAIGSGSGRETISICGQGSEEIPLSARTSQSNMAQSISRGQKDIGWPEGDRSLFEGQTENLSAKVPESGQGDVADTSSREHTEHEAKQEGRDQVRRYCAESNMAGTINGRQERAKQQAAGYTQHNEGNWSNFVWLPCTDGKLRRAPDDTFGLVDGLHRSLLAALGNSIVPQVAYEIIRVIREKREG